jgi:hypothetical protein
LAASTDGNIVLGSVDGLHLGSLAFNGGPTRTMALLPDSPAIGAGTDVSGLTTDQRGEPLDSPRPDIGAFQVTPPTLVVKSIAGGVNIDPAALTLAGAVHLANQESSSVITFDPHVFGTPQTIALASGPLDLAGTITILGPGAGLAIDDGGTGTVVRVEQGAVARLSGLTLMGGSTPGQGGGLYNAGTVSLTGCTLVGSTAQAGGGLANVGIATLTNCTIAGNSASKGGGLLNGDSTGPAGQLTLVACTISGNSSVEGGGLYNAGTPIGTGAATLTDTIIAGNTGGGGPDDIAGNQAADVTGSYNLIGTGGSGGIVDSNGGNVVLTDISTLGLAPLGDYGGPTPTMALLPGSAALGGGTQAVGVTTDQRGSPLDALPDVGAYQSRGFTLVPADGSTPQSTAPGSAFGQPLAVAVTANDPLEPVAGGVILFFADAPDGGATVDLSATSAIIGSDRFAQVTATATDVGGASTVTAWASPTSQPAIFALSSVFPNAFSGLADQSVIYGTTDVTVTGSLTAGSVVQGESVSVTLNGVTQDATIGPDGSFSATLDSSDLHVSDMPYTIDYAYASDGSTSDASATTALSVMRAAPTISIADANATFSGEAHPATATIDLPGGATTPSVDGLAPTISYYLGSFGSAADLAGQTPLAGPPSAAGAYTIMAVFAGNADAGPASAVASLTIAAATPTLSVSDAGGTFGGSGTAFPATTAIAGVVAGTDDTPGPRLEGVAPTVAYYRGTYKDLTQLSSLTPLAAAPSGAGSYTAAARFAGSSNYASVSVLVDFSIAKATLKVTWAPPQAITYGTPLSGTQLDATAGVAGSFAYSAPQGAILPAGNGQPLLVTFTPTDAADYNVAAAATTIDVRRAAPILTVVAPGGTFDSHPVAASVAISGVARGIDDAPAAKLEGIAPSLTYYAGSSASGTPLGSAPLAPGVYSVVATFAGSADYLGSQSALVTFTIKPGSSTVVLSESVGSSAYGQPVTWVATVTAPGGVPVGAVTFLDGGTPIGSSPVDASGRATLTMPSLAPGLHAIAASFSSGSSVLGSVSGSVRENVAPDNTRVVLMSHGVYRKRKLISVSLTAEVQPLAPGGGTPTGRLTFRVKKKLIGTVTLSGGQATLTAKAASVLKKPLTIEYAGDGNFTTSTVNLRPLTPAVVPPLARTASGSPTRARAAAGFPRTAPRPQHQQRAQ